MGSFLGSPWPLFGWFCLWLLGGPVGLFWFGCSGLLVFLFWVPCGSWGACLALVGFLFGVPGPPVLCSLSFSSLLRACVPPEGAFGYSSCDILDIQCSLATLFEYSRPTSCNTVRVFCDISTPSCLEGSFLRCGCCMDRIVSLSVAKWRRSFCGALTGTTWPLGCQSHCCSRSSASGVANLRTRSCRGLQQCQPLWVGRVLGPCQCHWSL